MERTNPEVKLALAAERRLRRPAMLLRGLLEAAGRAAGRPDALDELLAGPGGLPVLSALLEAPAPAGDPERVRRPGRQLAPATAPAAAGGRLRSVPGGAHRGAPPLPATGGVPRAGSPPDVPALRRDESAAAMRGPHAAPLPRESAGAQQIAARRADLRRSLLTLPPASGSAAARLTGADAGTGPLRAGAPLTPRPPESGGVARLPGVDEGVGPREAPRQALHALVAAAERVTRGAPQLDPVAVASRAPGAAADAMPDAVAESAGMSPAAAPFPAAPAAAFVPGTDGNAADPTPLTASRAPPDAPMPGAAVMPRPAAPSYPRRQYDALPLRLDDDADALAEAAWRNGVDLS